MKSQQLAKMRVKLTLVSAGILSLLMLFGQQNISAQPEISSQPSQPLAENQWTDEQNEVWDVVVKLWDFFEEKDQEGALNIMHPDFRGWFTQDPLPRNKADEKKWTAYFLKIHETLVTDLKPVAIDIHDNFAFVHYYCTLAYKDADGKHSIELGRWTDIYKKEGNSWLLICDHGGPISKHAPAAL